MEPFDLLILVVIADFVQQGVTQQDYSVTGAVLAVGTFGFRSSPRPGSRGASAARVRSSTATRSCSSRTGSRSWTTFAGAHQRRGARRSGAPATDRLHEHDPLGHPRDDGEISFIPADPPASVEWVRICSLVPAATEILFGLGLGESRSSASPTSATGRPRAERPAVTASLLDTSELSSTEIDRAVVEAAQDGKPLYAVDEAVWEQIDADVVVAQDLCEVCAVSTGARRDRPRAEGRRRGRSYSPSTWTRCSPSIVGIGRRSTRRGGRRADRRDAAAARPGARRARRGGDLAAGLRLRMARAAVRRRPLGAGHGLARGRHGSSGHVRRALVTDALDRRRRRSSPTSSSSRPCGFDLDRTLTELVTLDLSATSWDAALAGEPRVRGRRERVLLAPGPRLVDGVELLAYLIHPALTRIRGSPESASDSEADPDLVVANLGRDRRARARRRRGTRRSRGRTSSCGRRT